MRSSSSVVAGFDVFSDHFQHVTGQAAGNAHFFNFFGRLDGDGHASSLSARLALGKNTESAILAFRAAYRSTYRAILTGLWCFPYSSGAFMSDQLPGSGALSGFVCPSAV